MYCSKFQSCIGGFHIYKLTWTPFIRETLSWSWETSNLHNQFAVKVLKTDVIVHTFREFYKLPRMLTTHSDTPTILILGDSKILNVYEESLHDL